MRLGSLTHPWSRRTVARSVSPHPPDTPVSSDLEQLHDTWEALARSDPLWAILSEPDKSGRRWKLDEFFARGATDVTEWLGRAAAAGIRVRRRHAVDFGCGIGRLTQALGREFGRVTGIDISETMVAVARSLNAVPDRVEYVHNVRNDLSCIPDSSVDAVISHITLQHMRPEPAERYLREFFRIARPGALIYFQLPSHISEEYLPHDAPNEPLSAEECRAELTCLDERLDLVAGRSGRASVRVTNVSGHPWIQSPGYSINLANRWLTADDGRVVAYDDGRTRLPGRLPPGESAVLPLEVHAPDCAGDYRLQFDLVQEGVRWFQDAGSPVAWLPCRVVPDVEARAPRAEDSTYSFAGLIADRYEPAAAFEMHGICRSRVEEVIRSGGGRLVRTDEHLTSWVSYAYYVQAAPAWRHLLRRMRAPTGTE